MSDTIHISKLALHTHLGVPEWERGNPQLVQANLTLVPRRDFSGMGDDLALTVDYAEVCQTVRATAAERPRKLLETLAEDICAHLLETYPLLSAELELRKFILPETEYVAIRIRRQALG